MFGNNFLVFLVLVSNFKIDSILTAPFAVFLPDILDPLFHGQKFFGYYDTVFEYYKVLRSNDNSAAPYGGISSQNIGTNYGSTFPQNPYGTQTGDPHHHGGQIGFPHSGGQNGFPSNEGPSGSQGYGGQTGFQGNGGQHGFPGGENEFPSTGHQTGFQGGQSGYPYNGYRTGFPNVSGPVNGPHIGYPNEAQSIYPYGGGQLGYPMQTGSGYPSNSQYGLHTVFPDNFPFDSPPGSSNSGQGYPSSSQFGYETGGLIGNQGKSNYGPPHNFGGGHTGYPSSQFGPQPSYPKNTGAGYQTGFPGNDGQQLPDGSLTGISDRVIFGTNQPIPATGQPFPVVLPLSGFSNIRNEAGAIFVPTNSGQHRCRDHSDCFYLREPKEWCARKNLQVQWTDKGCYCDSLADSCVIERYINGARQFAFCSPQENFSWDCA